MGPCFLRLASLAAVTAAAIAAGSSVVRTQERENNSGSYLFRTFCVSCHGADGKGQGPAADTLTRPVPDLTLLANEAGGVFPRERVRAVLEGTRPVPSHTGSAMPRWNAVFTTLERDGQAARKRLVALVDHIESLQQRDRS